MLFLLPFPFLPWNLSAVKLVFGFIPNLWIFLCPSSLIRLSSPILFQNNFQWRNFLEAVFPCVDLTHPAHLSLNKAVLVFFTSRTVLFNCQELDCWLEWSPTVCKCSYKHWLGWQVWQLSQSETLKYTIWDCLLVMMSLNCHRLLFFFFSKKSLELSPSLGQGHSLDSFEMDAAPPCSPAVVIAMDNFEGNK